MDEQRYNMPVKEWYLSSFSDDELGSALPETLGEVEGDYSQYEAVAGQDSNDVLITFKIYDEALNHGDDIYDLMGDADDSVIRERIFWELSDILDVEYDNIYDRWLGY